MQPDQTTVSFQREGDRVTARISGPSAQEDSAAAVLHRAGFVPVVLFRERFHRLPAGMTDRGEQQHAVTRAVDMLQVEGFDVSSAPDLIAPGRPIRENHEMSLGDRLGSLTRSISIAGHTREVVAALSELTAPGDGVLQRISEALDETAGWWEGLGKPADPHYANRLRYITKKLDTYALEIRAMRGELADRHTDHPLRTRVDRVVPDPSTAARVAAARSVSPTGRNLNAPALPTASVALPALPPARPSSAPRR